MGFVTLCICPQYKKINNILYKIKWRIAEKKLLFLSKTMKREDSNITKKALLNETFMGLKGLLFYFNHFYCSIANYSYDLIRETD